MKLLKCQMPQISNTTKENDWPGLTQRPPKLLNECICQSAVGTDIMRHLILSAQHIPMITRHLGNGSTSHFQGFMNTENSDKKCLGQENREINAYTTNTQSDKYCWYCQHISVKKVEGGWAYNVPNDKEATMKNNFSSDKQATQSISEETLSSGLG